MPSPLNTPIINEGKFHLNSIKGADAFDVSKIINENFYLKKEKEIIGEQLNSFPIITNNETTFTIVLASNETRAPKMFIDEETEINCEKNDEQLICEIKVNEDVERMEYEVIYKGVCERFISTNVIVTYIRDEMGFEYQNGSKGLSMSCIIYIVFFFLYL